MQCRRHSNASGCSTGAARLARPLLRGAGGAIDGGGGGPSAGGSPGGGGGGSTSASGSASGGGGGGSSGGGVSGGGGGLTAGGEPAGGGGGAASTLEDDEPPCARGGGSGGGDGVFEADGRCDWTEWLRGGVDDSPPTSSASSVGGGASSAAGGGGALVMRTATAGESLASRTDGDAAATAAETSASARGVLAATAATARAGARGISSWLTGSGVGVTERADDPPELEPSFDVPRGVLLNHDRDPRRPEAEPSFEPRRPSGGTRGSEEEGTSLSSAAYLPAAPFFFNRERARADHELARLRGGCDPAASRAASSAASFAAAFAAADGTSLLRSLSNEPLRFSGRGGGGVGAAARCASYDVDDDAATARSSVRKENGTRPRWPSAVRAMHHPEVPPPSMI